MTKAKERSSLSSLAVFAVVVDAVSVWRAATWHILCISSMLQMHASKREHNQDGRAHTNKKSVLVRRVRVQCVFG